VAVSQSVDLWSIGCIFSMTATWIVLGYQGIRQFDYIRTRAISDIVRHTRAKGNEPAITEGDFFHDGSDILPAVKEWHKYLCNSIRQTDHVTRKMLEFTEKHLLIRNRTISAKNLYLQLQELLEGCTKEKIPEGLEKLMNALLDLDELADSVPEPMPSQAKRSDIGLTPQDKPRKIMSRLEVPHPLLKTASRFESLSRLSTTRPDKSTNYLDPSHANSNGSNSVPTSNNPHISEQTDKERPVSMPPKSIQPRASTYLSVRTDEGKTPDPINVIQAHERLSGRSLKNILSPKEDQYVKAYFGTRDIVSCSIMSFWRKHG
jgi:hypothetical protein